MLLVAIRFAKGTVRFRAAGKSPERLLNLAAQRGILLWDARPSDEGLEATAAVRDYLRLRPLSRKAAVKTKILQKRGMPFIVRRYRGRSGLIAGTLLGAALLIFLSQFIWTVDLTGVDHVSETRLRGLLAESGVRAGVLRKSVDTEQVKREVLLRVEELSWMSVNISGCHANVEMKEKDKKPQMDKSGTPCNLKACADGVVTDILVAEGMTQVKKGSGVRRGDLLVSGMNAAGEGRVRFVRAKGKVMADVISEYELKLPKQFDCISLSENKAERLRLEFLTAHLPCSLSFGSFDRSVSTESASWLTVGGTALPLGLTTETVFELKGERVVPGREGAEEIFRKELLLWELFENGKNKLVSKEVALTESKEAFCCSAHYVFNGNIAESVDFSVEEGYN